MPSKTSEPLYPEYLPVRPEGYTTTLDVEPFEADEPGLRADPKLPEIFTSKAKIFNITPRIGTEIEGVQLSQLSKEGLDQVALLAAQRGVLVFVSHVLDEHRLTSLLKDCPSSKQRNQDFADVGPTRQREIVSHYGPLHLVRALPDIYLWLDN